MCSSGEEAAFGAGEGVEEAGEAGVEGDFEAEAEGLGAIIGVTAEVGNVAGDGAAHVAVAQHGDAGEAVDAAEDGVRVV